MNSSHKIEAKGLVTVSGPLNSGKSLWAEKLIQNKKNVTYIATSEIRNNDIEWEERIRKHRERRPKYWEFILYNSNITELQNNINPDRSILIDSLGGIVEQHLVDTQIEWEKQIEKMMDFLNHRNKLTIVVIEEIGWGLVPTTKIGHRFRERLSKLDAAISNISNQGWLVIKGRAIDLNNLGIKINEYK